MQVLSELRGAMRAGEAPEQGNVNDELSEKKRNPNKSDDNRRSVPQYPAFPQ